MILNLAPPIFIQKKFWVGYKIAQKLWRFCRACSEKKSKFLWRDKMYGLLPAILCSQKIIKLWYLSWEKWPWQNICKRNSLAQIYKFAFGKPSIFQRRHIFEANRELLTIYDITNYLKYLDRLSVGYISDYSYLSTFKMITNVICSCSSRFRWTLSSKIQSTILFSNTKYYIVEGQFKNNLWILRCFMDLSNCLYLCISWLSSSSVTYPLKPSRDLVLAQFHLINWTIALYL